MLLPNKVWPLSGSLTRCTETHNQIIVNPKGHWRLLCPHLAITDYSLFAMDWLLGTYFHGLVAMAARKGIDSSVIARFPIAVAADPVGCRIMRTCCRMIAHE